MGIRVQTSLTAFCLVFALLGLSSALARETPEGAPGADKGGEDLRRLVEKVDLPAGQALAILTLPADLQRKVLQVLAGEAGVTAFSSEDNVRLASLPPALRGKILGAPAGPASEGDVGAEAPGEAEKAPAEEEKPEPAPEKPVYPLQKVETDLSPFGADLFREDAQPMPHAPTIPTPAEYVLGPGDTLLIHYWNALVDTTFSAEISAEGRVMIPRAGEIAVGGATLKEARALLARKVHEVFKDASVLVTLNSLRSIRVFVVGEVKNPGLHTISALSTVLHALFTAGGPNRRGSFRSVRLLRAGKTLSEIDLYDFLRSGAQEGDVRVFSGDTVFVPLAGRKVRVAGEVRRPAVYELGEEKTLADVLALAGGIAPEGFDGAVRVERSRGLRKILLDVADPASLEVLDGDLIKVFPVSPEPLAYVEISGKVERPGRYQWREGMGAKALLAQAGGLLPDAYRGYAEIRRFAGAGAGEAVEAGGRSYQPAWRLVRLDLRALLAGEAGADVALEPMDRLHIPGLSEVNPRLTVEILGAVEKPGVVEYARGMRLLDLLRRDGQALSPSAHLARAEIVRLTGSGRRYAYAFGKTETRSRTVTIPVDLAAALAGDEEANPLLKPFDRVKIYFADEVRPSPTVTILGAVQDPQTFDLSSGMRVSDLVFKAGNITAEAYLDEAEIVRRRYDAARPGTYQLETFTIDLGKALQGDRTHDLLLENFDRVIVKRTSEYFVEVEVQGEVRFPGVYLMPKGSRLSALIERAGGYTAEAFHAGAFFTRAALKEAQEKAKKRFLEEQKAKLLDLEAQADTWSQDPQAAARARESISTRRRLLEELAGVQSVGRLAIRLSDGPAFVSSSSNVLLRDGDFLRIPETPVAVTVQGEVFAPGSVLFTDDKRIEYYVNQVGGLKEDADEDRIYLIKADGRALSRSAQGAFSVRWDAENLRWVRNRLGRVVEAGDLVIVPPRSLVVKGHDLTKDIVDILYKIALSAGVLAGIAG